MTKFNYTITFKDGTHIDTIADEWVGVINWTIFKMDDQEILRVVTSEIRMIERRRL